MIPKNEVRLLVQKEIEQDNSIQANNANLYCEAAYNEAATKQMLYESYLSGAKHLSMKQLKYSFSGFMQRNQLDILAPYIDKYFESVIELIDSNSNEYVILFVKAMFPDFYGREEYVEKRLEELCRQVPQEQFRLKRLCDE